MMWIGFRCLGWMVFALLVPPALTQQLVPKLRVRKITYAAPKPVLGLPAEVRHISGLCASDGLTYYDTGAGSSTPADLYSLSPTAEVKHFRRKLPVGFNELTVKNFYPFELGVVTLLEANKRDEPKSKPTATEYFLSTSDHDGDQGDLLALSLRFKPVKMAAYASGDFLVLGWDTANQLPLLAMLKPDGTVRRFLDLGDMQRPDANATANADLLTKAAFVPYGADILLTYPGTTQPLLVLPATGQSRSVPLVIPGGYVLHDVLGSDGKYTLVARLQALPVEEKPAAKADPANDAKPEVKPQPPQNKVFEYGSTGGNPLWEFVFGKVPVDALTCAAKQSLTAVYFDAIGDPVKDSAGADVTPTQLYVGTARR